MFAINIRSEASLQNYLDRIYIVHDAGLDVRSKFFSVRCNKKCQIGSSSCAVQLVPHLISMMKSSTSEYRSADEKPVHISSPDLASEDSGDQDKYPWTHAATLRLISTYNTFKDQFANPRKKKKTVWANIAKILRNHGYQVTGAHCDKKWRNLKGRYKIICENFGKSARKVRRGKLTWEYFEAFHEIYRDDPLLHSNKSVNPMTVSNQQANQRGIAVYVLPVSTPASASQQTSLINTNQELTSNNYCMPNNAVAPLTNQKSSLLDKPPEWLLCMKSEHQEEERKRMVEMKRMHNEAMEVQREKNQLLRELLDAIRPTTS